MKTLFETLFTMLFIGLIIVNLPTIIGFVSLCIIIYVIYSTFSSLFVDGKGKTTVNYDRNNQTLERSENVKKQTMQNEHKTESETKKTQKSCSSYNCPRYRQTNYDSYWDDYDYYDDRQDEMPPEEGDGFRGTGGPFL